MVEVVAGVNYNVRCRCTFLRVRDAVGDMYLHDQRTRQGLLA